MAKGSSEWGRTTEQKLKVFISYSRRDIAFADRLVSALEARGLEVMIDRRDLPLLEEWQLELLGFIQKSDAVIFLISTSSIGSKWCEWEVGEVLALNKRLAPVVIEVLPTAHALPEAVGKINLLFFTPPNKFDDQTAKLVKALGTDIRWVKEHTRLGELARRWNERKRPGRLLLPRGEVEDAERWALAPPREAPPPTDLHLAFIQASRRGATKRQRLWIAGSLIVAVVSGALAIWAEINRKEAVRERTIAEQQRDRAEKALHQVVSTTNSLVFNISQKLKDRNGIPQSLVVDVLKEARRPLDTLVDEALTNPEIAVARSLALTQLSSILLSQEDVSAAREAADAAVAQIESAQTGRPDNPAWLEARRGAFERLARAQLDAGEIDAAHASFAVSLKAAQALEKAAPSSLDWRDGLAAAHLNMGDVLMWMAKSDGAGKLELLSEAESHYVRSREIREKDATAPAPTANARREQAAIVAKFGDLELARGDAAKAKAGYLASVAILEPLAAENPQSTQFKRDVAVAYQEVANALTALNQTSDAVSWLRKDLALTLELAESEPQRILWQRDLISSYDRLAGRLEESGDADQALAIYQKGLVVSERTVARDQSRPGLQRDMALTLEKIAKIEAKRDGEAAVEHWLRAIAVREAIPQPFPSPDWQKELEIAWRSLSDHLLRMGRTPEALTAAEHRVAAARALSAGEERSKRLVNALGATAWAALLAGAHEEALQSTREAIALAPQLPWIKLNHAHALMLSGMGAEARKIYLDGLEQDGDDAKQWAKSVRSDFADLRSHGVKNDLMQEIEAVLPKPE